MGFRVPRDARPNISTPDLSRPCEVDAGIRGGRLRRCLLRAHRVSGDSVRVDGERLERPGDMRVALVSISGPYTYRKCGLYFLKFSSSSSSPSSQFETLRSDPEFRRNSRVVFRGAPVISPKPQRSHT